MLLDNDGSPTQTLKIIAVLEASESIFRNSSIQIRHPAGFCLKHESLVLVGFILHSSLSSYLVDDRRSMELNVERQQMVSKITN
jgi:hypothetical protein